MAHGYLRRLGARVSDVAGDPIDVSDPALRLHREMGPNRRHRRVYPSHNPAPIHRQSDDDADE